MAVALAATVYAAAYIAYRATHVEVWERDNHPYVIFGSRVSYYVFRPLSYVDGATTGIGFHIGPHQQSGSSSVGPVPLPPQVSPQVIRDSVSIAIDSLVATNGSFGRSHAAGDFTGDRGGFTVLYRITEQGADSVLVALIDCFSDSSVTRVTYQGRSLSRGGLCYLALRNVAYRELDNWPGNFLDFPTSDRLRAAQEGLGGRP